MKRVQSHGGDMEAAGGEKTSGGWGRREMDPDPERFSHRRSFHKSEKLETRRISSPYRQDLLVRSSSSLSSSGNRIEQDSYGYRESPAVRGSSSYAADRMHRSESFSGSGFRREFPKGFRSERDRSRREGSKWRRNVDGGDDSGSPNRHREDYQVLPRSRTEPQPQPRMRLSSDIPRREVMKASAGVEMEEGEFEPDPEPKPRFCPKPSPVAETSNQASDAAKKEVKAGNNVPVSNDHLEEKKLPKDEDIEKNLFPDERRSMLWEHIGLKKTREEEKDVNQDQVMDLAVDESGTDNSQDKMNTDSMAEDVGAKSSPPEEQNGDVPHGDDDAAADGADEIVLDKVDAEVTIDEVIADNSLHQHNMDVEKSAEGTAVSVDLSNNFRDGNQYVEKDDEEPRGHGVDENLPREAELLEANKEADKDNVLDEEQRGDEHMVDEKRVVETQSGDVMIQCSNSAAEEEKQDNKTLKLLCEQPSGDNKGKGLAMVVLGQEHSYEEPEENDRMEGPRSLGFDLISQTACQEGTSSIRFSRKEDDDLKVGGLELSLCLTGSLQDCDPKKPAMRPSSPNHAPSTHSVPSSFRTNSVGFTASAPFSSSQPLVHNPCCSLTQISLDSYENSVGSKPLFQPADQISGGTMWPAQMPNDDKLFQRVKVLSQSSNGAINEQYIGKVNDFQSKRLSPAKFERSKDRASIIRQRSSNDLCSKGEQEGEKVFINGAGVIERVIFKLVSEPLHLSGRMLQEMTEHSVAYLKDAICDRISDTHKNGQAIAMQAALQRRSDVSMETLLKCHRVLLEILVAIKTGCPEIIKKSSSITSAVLSEIFLNMKCRNLACQNALPVDDCDCKICQQKTGFCSACMCMVCSKFDMATNTCSWVGCDMCLHWCHVECALRNSLIRKGRSVSSEMQFHCAACRHPSDMFGFVKEVFRTCLKEWNAETLAKELRSVRRVFSSSEGTKGRRLVEIADQMLSGLEDKIRHPEIVKYLLTFFSEPESDPDINHSSGMKMKVVQDSRTSSSKETAAWLPSVALEKLPCRDEKPNSEPEKREIIEGKPAVDELDSMVKFKHAVAKMYQERADDARKEAESLKRIAAAKGSRIDSEYASKVRKIQMGEAEERRKRKAEELEEIEREHRQYMNMKVRMEVDIRELLKKMEATKSNLTT